MESSVVRVRDEDSGRSLEATVVAAGADLVVVVGGGERPHVGCVVLAQPYRSKRPPAVWSASCSVLTIPPHKEEPIARGIAARLASALGRVAVVSAGVHDKNLDAEGVTIYLRLGEELAEKLVVALGGKTFERSNV
jgi:hypothetical protein